eukprot:403339587
MESQQQQDTTSFKTPFIIGKWCGQGRLLDRDVSYTEESTYILLRQEPAIVINAQQFTKHAISGAPMHAENGFIKILPVKDLEGKNKTEANYSHPFSLNEFDFGNYDSVNNKLTIAAIEPEHFQRGKTAKGKQTTGLKRSYWLDSETGDLCYQIDLAVDGGELKPHLECRMQKIVE